MALYNASHWPKHLLVQYTWRPVVQVDTAGGLLLVLLAGACVCMSLSELRAEVLRDARTRAVSHHNARVRSPLRVRSGQRFGVAVSAVLSLATHPAAALTFSLPFTRALGWYHSCASLPPAVCGMTLRIG